MQDSNFQNELQQETIRSEYNRIKLFIGALSIGFFSMGYLLLVHPKVSDFFQYAITPKVVVLWIFCFIVYETIMLLLVESIIKRKRSQSKRLKIINIVVETVFPGVLLFMLCYIEQTPKFLDSPLFVFYFILIVLSALHLNTRLAFLTSLLSAISYLCVTLWAIHAFDPEFKTMHLHPFLYEIRSVFILIGGFCAVFVTNEIKKRIFRINKLWEQKNQIEGLFGQQVSPEIANRLVNDENHSLKTEATIMFLDIRGYSSFSENMNPQDINKVLNAIFCPLIEILKDYNGIINQFLGDGFMATFGAPIEDSAHAVNAVKSGLIILDKIEELIDQKLIPPIKVGIGVHSGTVVTGNIGNKTRKQYSIIGTTVVKAARLEQLNKELATSFLISEEVYDEVKNMGWNFKRFEGIKLKGLEKSIAVYFVSKIINENSRG